MEIVKYHNDINKLKIGSFTENETDIFFSLLFKAKESKENIIVMDFLELKKLANGDKNKDRFIKSILGLNVKLKSMSQTIELEEDVYLTFSLFGDILTNAKQKKLEVSINPRFRYLIDDLVGNFTVFDLKELVGLKGNYSKILFRLLKQWESTKEYMVKMDDFIELMGIPKNYKMGNIDQKVFKPVLEQLQPYFKGLELEKIKKGVKVDSLKFTWKSKKVKKEDVLDIQPVKKKKAALGEKELKEHEKYQDVKDIPLDPVVELKKILKSDYEKLYSAYLKQLGEKHNTFIRKSFDVINKAKYEVIEDEKKFIETDIDENLLVSKTGKKLVGMARQHKIKKILEEMNKRTLTSFSKNEKLGDKVDKI